MAKRAETKNEFFEDLKAGLSAAIEHAKGKRLDLRTATLPRPPREMSAKEIAKIRLKLNMSQGVFSRALNISSKTVQAWEQGIGKPSGASLKLLSIVEQHPDVLFVQEPVVKRSRSANGRTAATKRNKN